MKRGTNRRDFIKASAAAGVGFWVAAGASPKVSRAANETINFACIGVGGKGREDSAEAALNGNIVAICDIDEKSLINATARQEFTKAQKFYDFRIMFDKVGKSIDAVTISTPDHTHAVATAMALKMGIACYTQKPLTHTIYEARRLGELAREHKVATQMGNQYAAASGLRKAAAVIQAGTLGPVKEVHVWTNRPIWPQGLDRPTDTPPVPDDIHWDQFIGPAPMRPYHPAYHPFAWRGWWDFGTGALGDMACHTLNMPYAGLDLRNPTSVQAKTSGHNKEMYPTWSIINYEFPSNETRPGLKLTWYDGEQLPARELFQGAEVDKSGALVIGEKGTLYAPGDYAEKYQLLGEIEEPEVEFKRSPGHFQEWVNAIKGGEQAMSNFPDYAGPLTEVVLLGNLAVWADGEKIEWDAEKMEAKNNPDVAHLIKSEYREGYTL